MNKVKQHNVLHVLLYYTTCLVQVSHLQKASQ